MSVLGKSFFNKSAMELAEKLLGKVIVSKLDGEYKCVLINETEAYLGEEDKGSHIKAGKTNRNKHMYENGGVWYIYLIYGMYWMMNVVSGTKEEPQAVLIRGGIVIEKTNRVLNEKIDGPGKLSRYLNVSKVINGKDVSKKNNIWIEDWEIAPINVKKTPRIGINYAEEWKDKEMRFVGLFDKL